MYHITPATVNNNVEFKDSKAVESRRKFATCIGDAIEAGGPCVHASRYACRVWTLVMVSAAHRTSDNARYGPPELQKFNLFLSFALFLISPHLVQHNGDESARKLRKKCDKDVS